MTKEEFEQEYAADWGMTVEEFHSKWSKRPIPCDCGEPGCQGWQMAKLDKQGKKIEDEYKHKITLYPVVKVWRGKHPQTGEEMIWVNHDDLPEPNRCALFSIGDPRLPVDIETCTSLQYVLGIQHGNHRIARMVFGPYPRSVNDPDSEKYKEWINSLYYEFDDLPIPDSYWSNARYDEPTPPP